MKVKAKRWGSMPAYAKPIVIPKAAPPKTSWWVSAPREGWNQTVQQATNPRPVVTDGYIPEHQR